MHELIQRARTGPQESPRRAWRAGLAGALALGLVASGVAASTATADDAEGENSQTVSFTETTVNALGTFGPLPEGVEAPGATLTGPLQVVEGEDIVISGTDWVRPDGTGSGINVLINQPAAPEGSVATQPSTQVENQIPGSAFVDARSWGLFQAADETGAWEHTISFPTPENSNLTEETAWTAGSTQRIQLLGGSLTNDPADFIRNPYILIEIIEAPEPEPQPSETETDGPAEPGDGVIVTEYNDGAVAYIDSTWAEGESISLRGEHWLNVAGDAGSVIAVKLDAGDVSPAEPADGAPDDVWYVIQAAADGSWEAQLPYPTPENSDADWAVGETHDIYLLTGSLGDNDRGRGGLAATVTIVAGDVVDPAPQWDYDSVSLPTGVNNGYQLALDELNRTVYLGDADWRQESRDEEGNVTVTREPTGKVVEFDSATRAFVRNHDFTGLTRNDGSGSDAEPFEWAEGQTGNQTSMRTTFSPYGLAVDGSTVNTDGVVDPTIVTTTARAQNAEAGYGGNIVLYSASQGEPNDADRIFDYADGTPVFDGPRRVAVNTETNRAFVTNLGQGRNAGNDGRPGHVTVLDTTKRGIDAVVAHVPVPNDPETGAAGVVGVAVDEENNLIYVGTIGGGDGSIWVIDGDAIVESDSSVEGHKDASLTANADAIERLDATAPLNARPTYNAELQRLYVSSYASQGTITVIDADPTSEAYGTVIDTIETGATNSVEVDGVRGLVYSANLGDREVVVYDAEDHAELLRLTTTGNAVNIGVDPVSRDVWVSNFASAGYVDVFSVTGDGYEPPVEPGPGPTDPEPTDPGPTDPEPTDPEPTDPEPTEQPSLPTTGDAPDEADLTDDLRGEITLGSSTVAAGGTVVVTLGAEYAGQTVLGWLFSDPVALGSAVVSESGQVTFTIPADVAAGEHRLVVTTLDGTVIGWETLTVTAAGGADVPTSPSPSTSPVGDRLGHTGASVTGAVLAAVLLALAGGAALLVRRRTSVG